MKKSFLLTVVLLTYNRSKEGYLKEALDAILNQTFRDFELLVVDNHSTDDTPEVILSYKDPRLYYIREPEGGNPTTSFNHALWMSRGEYVLFTHDDDIMHPELLENEIKLFMKNKKLMVVASNVSLIDQKGNKIQEKLYDIEKPLIFNDYEFIDRYFRDKIWFPTPTIMYHRDTCLKIFSKHLMQKEPEYFASGDLWAMFMMNMNGPIALIPQPLLSYRQHSSQESRIVNQSKPVLNAVKLLLKMRRKKLDPYRPLILAFYFRFLVQDILFNNLSDDKIKTKLKKIKQSWSKVYSKYVFDAIIPVEILFELYGIKSTLTIGKFVFEDTNFINGAKIGYRNWINKLITKKNIFSERIKGQKIAILGSMLNAHILVKNAQIENVKIKYCFDSSPSRIGKSVLGIKIISLDQIKEYTNNIDYIILTSEHDQEKALIKILEKKIKNKKIKIISWKELVC